ncbi:tetratricopeptide repeat protein [Azospirillum brasilense]|nr:tetratricopeptide repeat protein [Azospirillum brasilense]
MATIGEILAVAFADHRAGRVSEAAALYRRVMEADPANPNALYLLGMAEWQGGRPAVAPTLIGRALRLNPGWVEARVNRAIILDKVGHPAEATADWRRLTLFDPGHPQAWRNLGDAYQAQGDAGAPQAVQTLRRAARLAPGLAEVHHDLGVVLRRAGQIDEAVDSLVRAIAVKAELAPAHMNLSNTLLERGDDAAAQASLRRALALSPASPEYWYNVGNALYAHGDPLRALRAYRRSARLGLGLARLRVAAVLNDLGRLAEAEAELIESLPLPGVDVPLSIELLTTVFLRRDRRTEGRAFFTRLASAPLGGVVYRGECLTALARAAPQDGAANTAKTLGGILDHQDIRLKLTACSGVTGCDVGTTDTHADGLAIAERAAGLLEAVRMVHVSGCAKGCAHPGAADVTLTARDGVYDVALNAAPGGTPWRSGLTPSEAINAVASLSGADLSVEELSRVR